VIHKCRYCGKQDNIKIHITYGKPIKSRSKKDPNESVTVEQFIERNRKSKQRHINIIAEWADELNQADILNGQYKTRAQWDSGFFKPNLKAAREISNFDNDQISIATGAAMKDLIKNGGFMNEVKLSTVLKKLNAGIK